MNRAVEQGYIEHSPIARVKNPQQAIRDFFVRSDDWRRLVASARGCRPGQRCGDREEIGQECEGKLLLLHAAAHTIFVGAAVGTA